jgi:uncharacterized protein
MKLQPDRFDNLSVQAHGPGWVMAGGQRYTHSVALSSAGQVLPWPCTTLGEAKAEHFESLLPLKPEVVVLGTGPALQFPKPELLRPLIAAGVGVETMDTAAAARTFNILAGEGRRVVAALMIGDEKTNWTSISESGKI